MTTAVHRLTIRAEFLSFPTNPPSQEWEFTSDPADEGFKIDEQAIESELTELFEQSGGQNTLTLRRTLSKGGWGATGYTSLDILISVAENVVSTALMASAVAIYKKFTNRDPKKNIQLATVEKTAPTPKRRAAKKAKGNPPKRGKRLSRGSK